MLTALIPSKKHNSLNLPFPALALLGLRADSLPLHAPQLKPGWMHARSCAPETHRASVENAN